MSVSKDKPVKVYGLTGVRHYKSVYDAPLFHTMTSDFGKSNTDKTSVRPDVSSVRAFLGSVNGTSNMIGLYDFNDGKDTGERLMTFLRSKSIDPAEIDSAMSRIMSRLDQLKQEDVDKFVAEQRNKDSADVLAALKSLSSNASDSQSQTSNPTT